MVHTSKIFGPLSLALLQSFLNPSNAHVVDICVAPPGDTANSGVYNFFSSAADLGCDYRNMSPKCVAAVISDSSETFGETSICRGVIHFNAVYFTAAALGFTQDIAYQFAAFSQAIDYTQYAGIDSCGREMDKAYWTPPLLGLKRTTTAFGGTNRHLGIPFAGWMGKEPKLTVNEKGEIIGKPKNQKDKMYNGGSDAGCRDMDMSKPFSVYAKMCPALRPDYADFFYEGALASARKWAFGDTNVLCNGGYTVPDRKNGDSVFTGDRCPKPNSGTQVSVNVGPIQEGPIPLGSASLVLGPQVIHFECTANCDSEDPQVDPESVVLARDFGEYLKEQSQKYGYATLKNGKPVPELVARMGFLIHWAADRASHWYCTDAPGSGVWAVRNGTGDDFNLFLYLDPVPCSFIQHSMVHYWEQGVAYLAPGSYTALQQTYRLLAAFRKKHLKKHPEWFRPETLRGKGLLSEREVVGTYNNPGILFNLTMLLEAKERVRAEMVALKENNLPPMPGFESFCKE